MTLTGEIRRAAMPIGVCLVALVALGEGTRIIVPVEKKIVQNTATQSPAIGATVENDGKIDTLEVGGNKHFGTGKDPTYIRNGAKGVIGHAKVTDNWYIDNPANGTTPKPPSSLPK